MSRYPCRPGHNLILLKFTSAKFFKCSHRPFSLEMDYPSQAGYLLDNSCPTEKPS